MPELNEILVQLQIDFGYKNVSKKGTCQGFEMMGLIAFLSRDEQGNNQLPRFRERNEYIREHPNFAKDIRPILEKLEKKNKILDKHKVLTSAQEEKFQLTPEELELYEKYIDIRAYLDCMRLFQRPSAYDDIYGEKLDQSNLIQIAQLAQSLMMDDQNGVAFIGSLVGVYTAEELTKMMGQLRHLLNVNSQDGALSVGSGFHGLGVCYDTHKKEWNLINANKDHTPYPCYKSEFPSMLDKIMAEFIGLESEMITKMVLDKKPDHFFLLGMDLIATQQNAAIMHQIFEEFKTTPAYQEAHTLTKEKAEYKDKNGFTLLDMAIRHKELDTFLALRNRESKTSDKEILKKAALNNSPEIVHALATEGVNLNQELLTFQFGMIAHEAARNGNLQMLKIIDQHHGRLNGKDLLRRTPLDLAKKYQRVEVIKFLESIEMRNKLINKISDLAGLANETMQHKLETMRNTIQIIWEQGNLSKNAYHEFLIELKELKGQNRHHAAKHSTTLFQEKNVDIAKQDKVVPDENKSGQQETSPSFSLVKTPREDE